MVYEIFERKTPNMRIYAIEIYIFLSFDYLFTVNPSSKFILSYHWDDRLINSTSISFNRQRAFVQNMAYKMFSSIIRKLSNRLHAF